MASRNEIEMMKTNVEGAAPAKLLDDSGAEDEIATHGTQNDNHTVHDESDSYGPQTRAREKFQAFVGV